VKDLPIFICGAIAAIAFTALALDAAWRAL
jgi:hypothetical protein